MAGDELQVDVLLQRARARLRRQQKAVHSALWWWLFDNLAKVEIALGRKDVDLRSMAEELGTAGIHDRTDRPPTPERLRRTLVSVRAAARKIERGVEQKVKPPGVTPVVRPLPERPVPTRPKGTPDPEVPEGLEDAFAAMRRADGL